MKTIDFAKLAGVSQTAVEKAVKTGSVIKKSRGVINPNIRINKAYVEANASKRKSHKMAANLKREQNTKSTKRKKTNNKKERTSDIGKQTTQTNENIPDDESRGYASKLNLERANLALQAKLKQVQLSKLLREVIPLKLVEARLAAYQTALQNCLLILPERIIGEIATAIMTKGEGGIREATTILSKAIALGVKESKRAIEAVTDYEIENIQ